MELGSSQKLAILIDADNAQPSITENLLAEVAKYGTANVKRIYGGWAHLAPVGSYIAKQSPGFDPRNYGFKKLGELLHAMNLFELEERPVGEGQSKALYIRDKRKQVNRSN